MIKNKNMRQNTFYIWGLMLLALGLASCGNKEKEFDATGTFEATEVTVSAEQNGTLLSFDINEGDKVSEGTQVGLIDTLLCNIPMPKSESVGRRRVSSCLRLASIKRFCES